MATSDKLNYLIDTKQAIKTAIQNKGVEIADSDAFRSYADKISSIPQNVVQEADEWKPEPDWWDIETILENDTEDYAQKAIFLLTDQLDSGNIINIQGFAHYKTSDGQEFNKNITETFNISNIFDISQDKECSKGYKTRYIIGYTNLDNTTINANINIPYNSIYIIYDNIYTNKKFNARRFLEGIKTKNNCRFTNFSGMFSSCYSLQSVPNLDTSSGTDFSSMFSSCYSLQSVPNLDTSSGTDFSSMFSSCCSLQSVPNLDTSSGTDFSGMFSSCYSLQSVPNLDTSSGTDFSNMFGICYCLQSVPNLDTSNGTDFSNMFGSCYCLYKLNISKISTTLSFSISSFLTYLSLLNILNALVDLTGQDAKTLTLGTTNIAKLTDEEKAIATDKNWILK